MKKFINDNFLLTTDFAQELYNNYAKDCPIIDYHCHLDPKEIAEDKQWDNIAQMWLAGDHYKWRAMRTNGVEEKYCTGEASDREKFQKFAEAMPNMLRNPIYDWTHLEMARYFGIDDILLNGDTAQEVWDRANAVIAKGFSAKTCMLNSNVEAICTTDDPISDLKYHKQIAKDGFAIKVLPTFRPDKAVALENANYTSYIEELGLSANIKISSYDDLLNALKSRHDYFDEAGCKLSDNGLETMYYSDTCESSLDDIFKKALSGAKLSECEINYFKSSVLIELGKLDSKKGWVRQIHIGPMRNNNSAMFNSNGADIGFDSIGQSIYAKNLSRHLDTLNSSGDLGKTILYNIDPKDNEMLATMLGNFQASGIKAKLQLGSAWWFMDNISGMKAHLDCISRLSLLPCFVGMLTDSRSFLSYTRHEYFRRILCALLGEEMAINTIPQDMDLVGSAVKNISYTNAKKFFNF
ncbi:MAG: glucuronate isomerase [Opitutales bacterium]